MKRIILSLGMLLMLAQNGFAMSGSEASKIKYIRNQVSLCNKQMDRNLKYADVNICLKAKELMLNNGGVLTYTKQDIASVNEFIGVIYDVTVQDKIKAYKYYMLSARQGSIEAQHNLHIMCKENPWACQ